MRVHRRILLICLGLIASSLVAVQGAHALVIDIQVSPSSLNLQMKGEICTIHTNVDFDDVAAASVTLNNIPISWWKDDNRGDFVAKFQMDDVKRLRLNVGQYNEFTIDGLLKSGERFTGSTDVMIMNNTPTGRDF